MFTIKNLVQPNTLEEAYTLLTKSRSNAILGGCAYLRLGSQTIHTGVDLVNLGLDYINDLDDRIEVGASATLRDLEVNGAIKRNCPSVADAVSNIIGVQFRNGVTVGASVFSKYGFSDLIPALAVLDTDVELYNAGRMPLSQFLERRYAKDILTKVIIYKTGRRAQYLALRNSASDYPILTVAVSQLEDDFKIAIGARPTKAKYAEQAARILSTGKISSEIIVKAAEMAAEEIPFGSNMRGSAEYRRAMSKILVRRALVEVTACK